MPTGELRRTSGGPACKDRPECEREIRLGRRPAELTEHLENLERRVGILESYADTGDVLRALYACRMVNETLAETSMLILTWGARNGETQKDMAVQLDIPASTLTGLKRTA
jgi:hypothetical protein